MTKIFGPSMMGVLLSAIILNGCGTEPVDGAWGDSDGLVVLNSTVRFVFTESIDTFVAIVTDSDRGVTSELSCPDTTDVDSPITCFSGGIELKAPPERVRLVVKARGYAFASGNYAVDDIPAVGAHREASVQLTPLVPFEHTDTYASGFGKNDFDRFESLSVSVETALGPSKAVKFYIDDLQGTPIVYFQNTDMYPLHYLFAKNVLGDGRDAHTFEIETYTGQSRNAAAGVLIHYSTPAQSLSDAGYAAPVTLNFAGYDDISPGLIADVHRLIEERLSFLSLSGKQSRLVYMPAGDAKEAQANDAKTIFNTAGVPVLSQRQLWGEQRVQLLNDGVAFGILRRLTPEALEKTVVSFSDILILTRLPSTLPPVAGTITEEMQTPLSHVNIAAKIRGTPNMVYGDASSDDAFLSLIGQMVRFEIKNGEYTLRAATTEEAEMHRDELLKSRLTPKCDLSKQVLLDFETLVFGDADAYGTKSANLGALKTMLPGLSPDGFAVPFFYYEQFLTQAQVTLLLCGDAASDCEEEGRSAAICADAKLRCNAIVSEGDTSIEGYIDQLLENKDFLTNTSLREALLDGVRYHIRHNELTPETSALLIDAVEKVFGDKKVRLRSSTNAEDLTLFSGAGLYKSVSAFAHGEEKKVEKQILKVWASVWNFRAFEERVFWNVDHRAVKMGVAVSTAYPDEAANGVLVTENLANPMEWGMYVNLQQGETSITNPENGATPEIFSLVPGADNTTEITHLAFSSLSPAAPIMSADEIRELVKTATFLSSRFRQYYDTLPLDLEFKLYGASRQLVIKQVRPFIR